MTPRQREIIERAERRAEIIARAEQQAAAQDAGPTPEPPPGVRPAEDGYMVDERARGRLASRNQTGIGAAANFMAGLPFVGERTDETFSDISGDPYMKEWVRGATEQYAEDSPLKAGGARLAGGVTGSIPAAAAAFSAVPAAAPLGVKMATGSALGAGFGALEGGMSGYFSGETPEESGQNATTGTATGGALGMALGLAGPAVAKGAELTYQGVKSAVAPRPRVPGIPAAASDAVSDALRRDQGLAGGAGERRIASIGPDAMLADAGPASKSMLDTALQGGGDGVDAAMASIERRAAQSGKNVRSAFDQTFGPYADARGAERAIREGSKGARKTAYDAAYETPINYADNSGRALEDNLWRVPPEAITRANRMMQGEGVKSKQILASIGDDGDTVFTQMPDTRQLDYITRALRDLADATDGQGKLGSLTDEGRIWQNLARELRGHLKTANPAYAEALETAADPISRRMALRFGADKFLSRSVSRDEVEETVKAMSGPEKRAFKEGVRSKLDDTMAQVTRAVMDGNMDAREATKALKDLSSRFNQDKLKTFLNAGEMRVINAALERATAAIELRGSVATGSRTYGRQATDDLIARQSDTPIERARQGRAVDAGRSVVQALIGGRPTDVAARQDAIKGQIANLLTRQDAAEVLAILNKTSRHDDRTKEIVDLLAGGTRPGQLLTYGAASSGGLTQ